MPDNPYRPLGNVSLYRKNAANWLTFAKRYPEVWGFQSFTDFAAWRNATNPSINLSEWDNFEYFQEYYHIYPEGRASESELEKKALARDREEAERLKWTRKQVNSQGEHHAGGLSSALLLPVAAYQHFKMADNLQDDARYKDIVEKLVTQWSKENHSQEFDRIFLNKDGVSFLNADVLTAIPGIHQAAESAFRRKYGRRAKNYDKRGEKNPSSDHTLDPKIQGLFREIQIQTRADNIEKLYQIKLKVYNDQQLGKHGMAKPKKEDIQTAIVQDLVYTYAQGNFSEAKRYAAQNQLIAEAVKRIEYETKLYHTPALDPVFQDVEKRIAEKTRTELAAARDQRSRAGGQLDKQTEIEITTKVRRQELEAFIERYPEKAEGYARTHPEIREALTIWKREQAELMRRQNAPGLQLSADEALENALQQKTLEEQNAALQRLINEHPLLARELAENNPLVKRFYEQWRQGIKAQYQNTATQEPSRKQPSFQMPERRPPPSPQRQQQHQQAPHLPRPARKAASRLASRAGGKIGNMAVKAGSRLLLMYSVPIGVVLLVVFLIIFIIILLCVILGKCSMEIPPTENTQLTIVKTGQETVANAETISYTITVSGTSANPFTVVDTIFGDVEYVSADPVPLDADIITDENGSLKTVTWRFIESRDTPDTPSNPPLPPDSCVGRPDDPKWENANQWDSLFLKVATEFGMEDKELTANLLKAMALKESNGIHYNDDGSVLRRESDAYDNHPAIGMMQVKPFYHYQRLNLKEEESEAYVEDPEGNIRMAAKIMADSINEYGSWEDAIRYVYFPGDDLHITQDEHIDFINTHKAELDAATDCPETDTASIQDTRLSQALVQNTAQVQAVGIEKYFGAPYYLPRPTGDSDINFTDEQMNNANTLGAAVEQIQPYLLTKYDAKYMDPFLSVMWTMAIEGSGADPYSWNCNDEDERKGKQAIDKGCADYYNSGDWQVGYGIQVSDAATHLVEDFREIYGTTEARKVQEVGNRVISNGGITNPNSMPAKSVEQLVKEACCALGRDEQHSPTPTQAAARQALAILLMDPAVGAASIAIEVANNIKLQDNWVATMKGWVDGYDYYDEGWDPANPTFSNRIQLLAERYTGEGGTQNPPSTNQPPTGEQIKITLTVRPKNNDTYIYNVADILGSGN